MRGALVLLVVIAAAAPARADLAVGDRVVATWKDGGYYAGVATALDRRTVTVAWSDGDAPSTTPRGHVFAIPPPARRRLAPRTWGVCAWTKATTWYDCRVVRADDAGVTVRYRDGTTRTVGYDEIVVPTGAAARELARRVASDRRRRPRR
ncbi:MAG: hypothetical protein JNK64_11615 [Myxococcales bacterium]|nr:hypothetical protein [Myxococcales bacterium]